MGFNIAKTNKKRVVIIGGGFGGLKLANKLKGSNFQVVLIDKNNFHQFPPLLYQVASSGLEPGSIIFPFRKIFQKQKDFYFRMAEVKAIIAERNLIETSIGVDRMFLQILSAAYTEEEIVKEDGSKDSRVVLKLPPALAPIKLAVMPLVKKDGLPEKAEEIMKLLRLDFRCQYDEKDSIGKRYRRQDAIGTPFCITIDHQTLEDNAVTIRYRDTMEQERVAIDQLHDILRKKTDLREILKEVKI